MRRLAWVLVFTLLFTPTVTGAEILFQEDFEDGNLSSRGWYDIASWGTELLISSAQSRSGNGSLEHRYRPGSTGAGWMRRQFPGRDRVYSRYYRKWAANWQWGSASISGPHDTLLFAMYGQRTFAPTQTYLTVYTESIYQGHWPWQKATIGFQTRRILQGEDYWAPPSINPPPPRFQLDRWYCIETLAIMNTAGQADGRVQLWLDGMPIFDVTGLLLRDSANTGLRFDQFMWGPYYHGGTPQTQSTWLDALVVATDRVGCLDDGPPHAPTNLRVMP